MGTLSVEADHIFDLYLGFALCGGSDIFKVGLNLQG
jgi:hypothetical protein